MGKHFGNLYYIRNIVYYRVSSYEQKAFANFGKESIRNLFNEFKKHGPVILPPFALAYLAVKGCEAERMRMVRKAVVADDDE